MIWIPIIYLCASSCLFMIGQPEFTLKACQTSLERAAEQLIEQGNVQALDGTCAVAVVV
jgi:hypothetical protein